MAGLDPAIHVFPASGPEDVDARVKPGHDDVEREVAPHAVFAAFNPSRASTASRITNFWIFPVTVIGNSSTNST